MSSPLPDWMIPPREEGWLADDLDKLTEAPRHTELLDGALIFMMSPQRRWHGRVVGRLASALEEQAPAGILIDREITVRLDRRSRPEPDIVASTSSYEPGQTWLPAVDVILVIEVTSPESEQRDRGMKLRKYAEAAIPHYWILDEEAGGPAVHVYELDQATEQYIATGIARNRLQTSVPFPLDIDLTSLA